MALYEKMMSGDTPIPECSKTLGTELQEYSPDSGKLNLAFYGTDSFTNPGGNIQGGFLCAMLDELMSLVLIFSLPETQTAPTLELKTQFLRAAKPGRIEGTGQIISKGRQISYLEGELFQNGRLIAKATATALIRDI